VRVAWVIRATRVVLTERVAWVIRAIRVVLTECRYDGY
jgi:hypothetical protein